MIEFQRHILNNGLTVLLHRDSSTPLVTVNVLYKVGSRNESVEKTGFAHLFEHLMFGGSENVPDYDRPLQEAGGENNAFTNSDLTNFYNIVPAENLETALWLESDRMRQLDFSQKSLDTQKKVVVEEFYETSINKPYGDIWHLLMDLSYKSHPYRWPTIGLVPAHIEEAEMKDVKAFFEKYYKPNNAIVSIAGNIDVENTLKLVKKWFGDIPRGQNLKEIIPEEPSQKEYRQKIVHRDVPSNVFCWTFQMPNRKHPDFPVYDLITDVLSGGRSSRFHQNIIKKTNLLAKLSAYVTGTLDKGLIVIEGTLLEGKTIDDISDIVWNELNLLKEELISEDELQKIKNNIVSNSIYSETSIVTKAIDLGYYEHLGNVDEINDQNERYLKITNTDIMRVAKSCFVKNNMCELHYLKN